MCQRTSMRQYASSPRKDESGLREVRGKRLQGIAEGASSAPCLASLSAASRWARATPWRERGGSKQEHGGERVDSIVKEGRFQGGKGGQARRASLEQVEGSMSG